MVDAYIFICSYQHSEKEYFHPSHVLPTPWKLQWPKLVLWSPSLKLGQRSRCIKFLGIGRIPSNIILNYFLEDIHQHKILFWIPTYTWLAFSVGGDWLVPMCYSSGANGVPPSWMFSILDIIIIIIMFVDMIQQLDNTSHKIRRPWQKGNSQIKM